VKVTSAQTLLLEAVGTLPSSMAATERQVNRPRVFGNRVIQEAIEPETRWMARSTPILGAVVDVLRRLEEE